MKENVMSCFTLIIVLAEMLCSCDPGYSVILTNRSQVDRDVKVTAVNKDQLHLIDSISVADTSGEGFFSNMTAKQRLAVKKTSNDSYSFVLAGGKEALLQSGIGGPDLNQNIIIDINDTILLRHDRRSVIKRKFMYTSVKVILE